MRLVVDTNLMIRALLSAGPAREFFNKAPLIHTIVFHHEQLLDLRDVAARPRLAIETAPLTNWLRAFSITGKSWNQSWRTRAILENPGDTRDSSDGYILGLALAGRADAILSEDQDLLVLNPWRGIRIMRLFQFVIEHPLT